MLCLGDEGTRHVPEDRVRVEVPGPDEGGEGDLELLAPEPPAGKWEAVALPHLVEEAPRLREPGRPVPRLLEDLDPRAVRDKPGSRRGKGLDGKDRMFITVGGVWISYLPRP
jgi:hypothetical protein